ncbi:MAG TPA: hypothetical protein VGS11_05275 [Candidatus Bathyarchaeia archaeon]|nr:hypothetical protein [Candidatus Bathyarchaeia archaeon]
MIVLCLGSVIGTSIANFSLLTAFGLQNGVIQIILGAVALVGAKKAGQIEWAIVLIVIGLIGGGAGGILVLLGGIISLVIKYA